MLLQIKEELFLVLVGKHQLGINRGVTRWAREWERWISIGYEKYHVLDLNFVSRFELCLTFYRHIHYLSLWGCVVWFRKLSSTKNFALLIRDLFKFELFR